MTLDDFDPDVDAVLFDFSDVVASVRMAFAGEEGSGDYRIVLNDDVVDGIRRLQVAGVLTGLVTNNDRGPFLRHAPHVPLGEMFDVDVFSSDTGVGKPNPRIFLAALERLGVMAGRSVFLDDVPRNVDAAIALGMQGVVIDRPATAVAVVDAVLARRAPRRA